MAQVAISIASPDAIRKQSKGEVRNDKTLLHKTFKPIDHGLFCQRVFGPVEDWQCACGKYKDARYKGIVCESCGVEVTLAEVRRKRMGHIELAVPVCHRWFCKTAPNYIGLILDAPTKELRRVICYEAYMVIDPGITPLKRCQILVEDDADAEERGNKEISYGEACKRYADGEFIAETGAQAIQEALSRVDLQVGIAGLQKAISEPKNKQNRGRLLRRLHLFQAFQTHGVRPEWMILTVLPVLPPELRPMVPLPEPDDDGLKFYDLENVRSKYQHRPPELEKAYEDLSRLFPKLYPKKKKAGLGYAISDLNDLYSRVIRQNNRLKALLKANPGRVNIQKEKLKLQEAVDALLDSQTDDLDPIANLKERLDLLSEEIGEINENGAGRLQAVASKVLELRKHEGVLDPENYKLVQSLLKGLKSSEITVQCAKTELEDVVSAILEGGSKTSVRTKAKRQELLSLSDRLKGKTGFFRQSLLGKRVDYSGRSVIVIGPELKLHQCGLPKSMALVLFEPFVIARLLESGRAPDIRVARRMFLRRPPVVWDVLQEVSNHRLVILNRAPSLHRLSVQAFEAVLIEGQAIRLHPLVCAGFNADFDGDTMAVHLPLSVEAQRETRLLMMASNNLFSPASGRPIVAPTQDITLGCFYLTVEPRTLKPADPSQMRLFGSKTEAVFAYNDGAVRIHEWVRLANPDFGKVTEFGDANKKVIETTVGRVILSEIWPPELGFPNKALRKAQLGELIWKCYKIAGHDKTVIMLDKLKEVGFQEATRAGISIGISDLIVPQEREPEIDAAKKEARSMEAKHLRLKGPEYRKEIEKIWRNCMDHVTAAMKKSLEANQGKKEYNPIWLMVESGARGSEEQVRQLIGLRGLMARPGGEIIERPILSNFREGLNVLEYFISGYGVRKGVGDKSRQTAEAGYLTRKLVSVAQDVIIGEEDCGTRNGIWVQAAFDKGKEVVSLADRLVGRLACEDICGPPEASRVIIATNQEIDDDLARAISQAGIKSVKIRSVLTCESKHGVCACCYGRNLTTHARVALGEAVGIIAAQSIGEPGTQLTMRTFHTGGTASQADITRDLSSVTDLFEVRRAIVSRIPGVVSSLVDLRGKRWIVIADPNTGLHRAHKVPAKRGILVKVGETVSHGQPLTGGYANRSEGLRTGGLQEIQEFFVNEVQQIYRSAGGVINDKHIEVILRQMLRKVRITEPGNTAFSRNEEVDKPDFDEENQRVKELGQQPSKAEPILLGITKASLQAKSFLSAASFQHTTQVLAEAAAMSRKDELQGLKEKVMTGGLIPVGTGFKSHLSESLPSAANRGEDLGHGLPASSAPGPAAASL